MMNFINSGGFELLLATGYLCYVLIVTKLNDWRKKPKIEPVKWNWN